MIIKPKTRGFICVTAHPEGCAAQVQKQIDYVLSQPKITNGPKKVLVLGSSTGYGLASRISASFGSGADTIGVFFERPAAGKRTASAGWYNSAAFEAKAKQAGYIAESVNGDAFSDEIKQVTIDKIKQHLGKVDLVVYSLATPRRTDPKTGEVFNSVLKTTGETYTNKTIDPITDKFSDVSIGAATEEEIAHTVKVMGGEDWQLWMEALAEADVLADGVKTVAYTYIGPKLTYPIYREGSIGRAKAHLEATAHTLNDKLAAINGSAFVSVNKAVVTQASAAIPVVPLYISVLFKLMKDQGIHEGCIEQIQRLYQDFLYHGSEVPVDDKGLIRIDDLEMRDDIQQKIEQLWADITEEKVLEIADLNGYRTDFYNLFGFETPGVDYDADVDVCVDIPSLEE